MSRAEAGADHRAERIKAFIYGTIATLIAVAAFETVGRGAPVAAGAIVAVSALATWFAHAYATVLGERLADPHGLTIGEVVTALRDAWPIVVAAVPATVLVAGATIGLWSLKSAILGADVAGIVVMAVAGFASARVVGAGRLATVAWILVTAAIGFAIVAVELAVHE